jgi:predicted SAM-dependent methyltransferase
VSADIVRDWRGDILKLDATKPWPFSAESLSAGNSEHLIEHISCSDAPVYLREAYRALRPGAPIRTSTPDLEALSHVYVAGKPEILEEHPSDDLGLRRRIACE